MIFFGKADEKLAEISETQKLILFDSLKANFGNLFLFKETKYNFLYRSLEDNSVIKISKKNKSFKLEVELVRLCKKKNIPVLEQEEFVIENGLQGIRTKYIENKDKTPISLIIPILKALHQINFNFYGKICYPDSRTSHWKEYLLANLEEHLLISRLTYDNERLKDKIRKVLADYESLFEESPKVLLHGDLSDENILNTGDLVLLSDFEESLSGDPVYELAFYGSFMGRRPTQILESYYPECVSPEIKLKFWLYFLRISLMKSVIHYREGRIDYSRRIDLALSNIN